ncbi:ComEC/Rec2 family competence protein [Candidatus Saccharibacteria bacterium]|nr:ComEC/Rec2 family competence protein [Candidatus Saccharibacteria bacterium]
MLGEKAAISDELNTQLRRAGLAHVVVASGFALSTIINLAKRYLRRLSRFAILSGSLILIFAFIALVGYSPSLLRAGLASILSLLFWYTGRRLHPVRLLSYVAALSALASADKFFSVAWWLSFASYAGILLIYPVLAQFFYGVQKPGFVPTLLLVSVAAQLACLPLSLYYFGSFAVLGLLSNLLVTPIIPAVMLLAFLAGLTPHLVPLNFILNRILQAQLFVIEHINDVPWATVEVAPQQPQFLALYLVVVLLVSSLKIITKYDYRPRYGLEKSADYGKIFLC